MILCTHLQMDKIISAASSLYEFEYILCFIWLYDTLYLLCDIFQFLYGLGPWYLALTYIWTGPFEYHHSYTNWTYIFASLTLWYASLTQSYFSVPIWMAIIILDTYIWTRAFQYHQRCESQAPVKQALLSSDNSCYKFSLEIKAW